MKTLNKKLNPSYVLKAQRTTDRRDSLLTGRSGEISYLLVDHVGRHVEKHESKISEVTSRYVKIQKDKMKLENTESLSRSYSEHL